MVVWYFRSDAWRYLPCVWPHSSEEPKCVLSSLSGLQQSSEMRAVATCIRAHQRTGEGALPCLLEALSRS